MSSLNKVRALGFFLALPLVAPAQPKPEGWPLGARIPAISGQVVDAFTGKPVANVDVTLRATLETGSGGEPLRYENNRTSTAGDFSFPTSLEAKVAKPFAALHGYWLTVNLPYASSSPGNPRMPNSDDVIMDTMVDDFSWSLAQDPLFKRDDARVSNRAYFPMTIEFVHPCSQMWNANCVRCDDTKDVRIPLIPILDNPEECARIGDAAIREKCRQLNTYRAAFLHVETIAEVRADKELCRSVDQGTVTKACLQSLEGYIANPGRNRLPLRMEVDPIEKVLILTPVAGMSVTRKGVGHLNPFRETAAYTACYSLDKVLQTDAACATVWWVPVEDEGDRRFASNFDGEIGYTKGAERSEAVEGNTITAVDLPKLYEAVWSSGSKVVKVIFYKAAFLSGLGEERARAAAASLEARRELIRQYLLKYPSDR